MARTARLSHISHEIAARRIQSSYWFVPIVMSSGAILLLVCSINADALARNAGFYENLPWLQIIDRASSEALLNTLVGALFTVIGTVFSLTMVVLALAASQYGADILQRFMTDLSTKFVLGTFIATFVYCFLALMWVDTYESSAQVPQVPISVAALLTFVSVGMLVFFIHHLALSIQVSTIIKTLGNALLEAIDMIYPCDETAEDADAQPDSVIDARFVESGLAIRSHQIVHFAGSNAEVMQHLLDALANVKCPDTTREHAEELDEYRRSLREIICTRRWEGNKGELLVRQCG